MCLQRNIFLHFSSAVDSLAAGIAMQYHASQILRWLGMWTVGLVRRSSCFTRDY